MAAQNCSRCTAPENFQRIELTDDAWDFSYAWRGKGPRGRLAVGTVGNLAARNAANIPRIRFTVLAYGGFGDPAPDSSDAALA
jgi:hypothetical protein